jgi:hypothetical protein
MNALVNCQAEDPEKFCLEQRNTLDAGCTAETFVALAHTGKCKYGEYHTRPLVLKARGRMTGDVHPARPEETRFTPITQT